LFLHHRVQGGRGARRASYPVGGGTLFFTLNRFWRDADHLLPLTAQDSFNLESCEVCRKARQQHESAGTTA
jgi:hypothetical protein